MEGIVETILTEPSSLQAIMGAFILIILGLLAMLWRFAMKANDQAIEAARALAAAQAVQKDLTVMATRTIVDANRLLDDVKESTREHTMALRQLESSIRAARGIQ